MNHATDHAGQRCPVALTELANIDRARAYETYSRRMVAKMTNPPRTSFQIDCLDKLTEVRARKQRTHQKPIF